MQKKSFFSLEREVNRSQKNAAELREVARLRKDALKRRVEVARLGSDAFQAQCRSIQERRVVAQIRTLKKRILGSAL